MDQHYLKIEEMPAHIKQRYVFAASAFVRMWGRGALTDIKIKQFCVEWAYRNIDAPLDDTVDQYFYHEFKTWRGY